MKNKKLVTFMASVAFSVMLIGCGNSNTNSVTMEKVSTATQAEATAQQDTTSPESSDSKTTKETEGETGVALDEGIEKYQGNWHEEIAGRGSMEISPSGDGKYLIDVTWGSSAFESAHWNFTALYDSSTGDLSYDDGTYQVITFDEDGTDSVTEEKSVHGTLHLTDEGKIEWTDSADGYNEASVFVKD